MKSNQPIFHDFDIAWAEAQKEPLPVKILGTVYPIPADIPAILPLKLLRESEGNEVSPAFIFDIVSAIFGQDTLDKWVKQGLSLPQLMDILTFVTSNYQLDSANAGNGVAELTGSALSNTSL